jgi:enamine deaminase RidA (YjgF/YER057c/UK114 family)
VCLRDAGADKGWGQVFRVNSYHLALNDEVLEKMKTEFAKWMPNHRPIWTTIQVPKLGLEEMSVEIEVCAHVGQ